jgi:multidrug resistance efflux pump
MSTRKRWISLIWVTLLLVGCSQVNAAEGQPAGLQPVTDAANRVIAEGSVVPARSGHLAFQIQGDVVAVLVETGQHVAEGESLIRLDRAELKLAVRRAEQDLLAQEAALQRLQKGSLDSVVDRADKAKGDQIAQAQVVLTIKRLRLEQARAKDPDLVVRAARARITQLEYQAAQMEAQDPEPAVTAAEVERERTRIALADTQDEYNKALDRPWEDQGIRDAWAKQLEQAQLNDRAAQANLQSAQNAQRAHALSLKALAAQIAEGQTGLAEAVTARDSYTLTLGILEAEVEAARLHLSALQADDNPYRDKATAEDLAQAEAMVAKARLAVEALRLQIEDGELCAPFAGTVVDVLVEPGDRIAPGEVVLILATLDRLEVHTTDLTELDVADVSVGQAAQVWVDALQARPLAGKVHEVALHGQDYRGDVVYTVIVVLEGDLDPALRWGMTTEVRIETDG